MNRLIEEQSIIIHLFILYTDDMQHYNKLCCINKVFKNEIYNNVKKKCIYSY
jgi:hypothetical protein